MRKTIYTICILILLVIAAFLVSPYFIGVKTQEKFQQQIDAFNQKSNYITIHALNYKRHWFHCDAQLVADVHTPPGMPIPFNKSYTYNIEVKHGPLYILTNHGKTSLNWGAGAVLIKGDSKNFKGLIAIKLGWDNEFDIFANIPHLVILDANNNEYSANDLTFTTQKAHGKNIKYTLLIGKASTQFTQNEAIQVNLSDLKLVIKGHDADRIWLGDSTLSVGKIIAGIRAKDTLVPLTQLNAITTNLETNLTSDKTKINSSLNFNIDSLYVLGNMIKPVTVSYSINGVDATAYRQLITTSNAMPNTALENLSQDQQTILFGALAKIIESGLTINVNKIYAGLPKELASSPLSASAQLVINPETNLIQNISAALSGTVTHDNVAPPDQQLSQEIANTLPIVGQALVKTITASGQASIPQSLIKQYLLHTYTKELMHQAANDHTVSQTPQALAQQAYEYLVNNKMFIINDDGSAKIVFTFKQNQLLINGTAPALDLPQPSAASSQTLPSAPMLEHSAQPASSQQN